MSAILFDLDGTLIDSAPDLAAAVNGMLGELGAPALTLAQVRSFIGNGTRVLVARSLAASGLDEADAETAHGRFGSHYGRSEHALTRLYPGAREALEVLAAGHRLGLVTNKPEGPAREVLEAFGLDGLFGVVIGGETTAALKPDPAPIAAAVEALGTRPMLFVGDSEVDAAAARNAGLPFALYTEGYRKSPVAEIPHAFAFADHAALPGLVAQRAA